MYSEAEQIFRRGQQRFRDGDFEGAFKDFDNIINYYRDDPEHFLKIGMYYFNQDKYEAAVNVFTKMIEIFSSQIDIAEARRRRSLAYRFLGKIDLAIADLDWIIKQGIADMGIYRRRGHLYLDQGNNKDAIADFTTYFDQNPSDNEILLLRAHAYFRLGNYEQVIADLTTLLEAREQTSSYKQALYHWRGKAFYKLGSYQQALDDFNQIMMIRGLELIKDPAIYINTSGGDQ